MAREYDGIEMNEREEIEHISNVNLAQFKGNIAQKADEFLDPQKSDEELEAEMKRLKKNTGDEKSKIRDL